MFQSLALGVIVEEKLVGFSARTATERRRSHVRVDSGDVIVE
jgi:hypothetical protein